MFFCCYMFMLAYFFWLHSDRLSSFATFIIIFGIFFFVFLCFFFFFNFFPCFLFWNDQKSLSSYSYIYGLMGIQRIFFDDFKFRFIVIWSQSVCTYNHRNNCIKDDSWHMNVVLGYSVTVCFWINENQSGCTYIQNFIRFFDISWRFLVITVLVMFQSVALWNTIEYKFLMNFENLITSFCCRYDNSSK